MRIAPVILGMAMAIAVAACRPEADTSGENAGASATESGAATATASPVSVSTRAGDTMLAAGLAKATFDVKGMTCGGCVIGVRKVLTRLDGVTKADVSYERRRAVVTYDPAKVTVEQMIDAIKTLGYKAAVVVTG